MARTRMRRLSPAPPPKRPKLPEGRALGEPEKKGERIRRLVAEGDWHGALKLGASLAVSEPDRTAIQRGWQALTRPAFAREMGKDPEAQVEAGKEALMRCFGPKA